MASLVTILISEQLLKTPPADALDWCYVAYLQPHKSSLSAFMSLYLREIYKFWLAINIMKIHGTGYINLFQKVTNKNRLYKSHTLNRICRATCGEPGAHLLCTPHMEFQ